MQFLTDNFFNILTIVGTLLGSYIMLIRTTDNLTYKIQTLEKTVNILENNSAKLDKIEYKIENFEKQLNLLDTLKIHELLIKLDIQNSNIEKSIEDIKKDIDKIKKN